MFTNKAVLGAIAGAVIAVVWVAFDGGAVLLVAGLAAAGWLVGTVFERPDALIGMLERLRDR